MKELIIIFLSSVKFAMTFPLAIMQYEFGFFQTVLWTNAGGFVGIVFFTYVSEWVIKLWNLYFRIEKYSQGENSGRKRKKKLFSARNRRIVTIKSKYGLPGVAILTPILFSIPVGAFLVTRYFRARKTKLLYLTVSNLIWSVIYTSFYTFCYDLYLQWLG